MGIATMNRGISKMDTLQTTLKKDIPQKTSIREKMEQIKRQQDKKEEKEPVGVKAKQQESSI